MEPLAAGMQASLGKWNLCSKSPFTHPLSGEELQIQIVDAYFSTAYIDHVWNILYILLLKIYLVRKIAFINYLSGECTLHWPWKSSLVLSRYFVVRKKYLMKWCKLPWPTFQSIAARTIHQLLAANVTFSRSFTNLSFVVNGMNDRLY